MRAIIAAAGCWGLLLVLALPGLASASGSFVNWENPHVHPLEKTPNGRKLLAVNTADNRLLVFDLDGSEPRLTASVPVGLEPVSVRARSNTEAWVVNHISDSVSIVDLNTMNVVATVSTEDEPADVVFAGTPQRAFITCSQVNTVLVVNPTNLEAAHLRVPLKGEDPRALAVSQDGRKVYAAIFESGNGSTVLSGDEAMDELCSLFPGRCFLPNAVDDPNGPYGGVNPPPNNGNTFLPRMNPSLPKAPRSSLIVKQSAIGRWMDDNHHDWTELVSGSMASRSGRPQGWTLPDRDLAIIDTATLSVTYATRLMNLNMALAVHPSGAVTVVGTDATNEVRFEPNLNGQFLRVEMAWVNPRTQTRQALWDLNPHLTYTTPTVAPSVRNQSIGDPRGIAWNAAGTRAYVAGMGSNNVVVVSEQGARVTQFPVGEGPTGVVVDDLRGRLYVLNRFDASLSVVSLQTHEERARVPFFDPTPGAIKQGRKHLYNTHENSGLGHISCGSCHVDGRMDKLAWDLGDPSGEMDLMLGKNVGMDLPNLKIGFGPVHPMKGPMVTQTLQDIIGKEVLHWRGDRDSLEAFNPAFMSLQGAEHGLTQAQMNEFKAFLATLTFPPNPFRNVDNSLSQEVPLPDRFAPNGEPLPDGDAVQGLNIFRRRNIGKEAPFISCATCHTLATGMGASVAWNASMGRYDTIAPGPNGENHAPVTATDFTATGVIKMPQLRNLYEKEGMSLTQQESLSGFGFRHNGATDSLTHFLNLPSFPAMSAQELADLEAFLLSFSGSDLPQGSLDDMLEPPGPASQDTHAAVGQQITLNSASLSKEESGKVKLFLRLADSGKVGLVVKGRQGGLARGYTYQGHGQFQSDRQSQRVSASLLKMMAGPRNELTWTVVAKGTERRIGIDRDEDGTYDRDELDAGACEDEAALDRLSCR